MPGVVNVGKPPSAIQGKSEKLLTIVLIVWASAVALIGVVVIPIFFLMDNSSVEKSGKKSNKNAGNKKIIRSIKPKGYEWKDVNWNTDRKMFIVLREISPYIAQVGKSDFKTVDEKIKRFSGGKVVHSTIIKGCNAYCYIVTKQEEGKPEIFWLKNQICSVTKLWISSSFCYRLGLQKGFFGHRVTCSRTIYEEGMKDRVYLNKAKCLGETKPGVAGYTWYKMSAPSRVKVASQICIKETDAVLTYKKDLGYRIEILRKHVDWDDRVVEALLKGNIALGIYADMADVALGKPSKVTKKVTAQGETHQRTYVAYGDNSSERQLDLVFKEGKLEAWTSGE